MSPHSNNIHEHLVGFNLKNVFKEKIYDNLLWILFFENFWNSLTKYSKYMLQLSSFQNLDPIYMFIWQRLSIEINDRKTLLRHFTPDFRTITLLRILARNALVRTWRWSMRYAKFHKQSASRKFRFTYHRFCLQNKPILSVCKYAK